MSTSLSAELELNDRVLHIKLVKWDGKLLLQLIINRTTRNVSFDTKKNHDPFSHHHLIKKAYFEIRVLQVHLSSPIYYECNSFYQFGAEHLDLVNIYILNVNKEMCQIR